MDGNNRTVWCGNLSTEVTEAMLYELFLQGGPLEKVRIPKDRDGRQRNFGFITFKHECSVPYSVALFEGTRLFNKTLILQSKNSANSNIPQRETDLNNSYTSERQRTQSLPVIFGSTSASHVVSDYNVLLQLGHHMFNPASLGSVNSQLSHCSNFTPSTSPHMYRSQMNNSYYLGGNIEKVSKTSYNHRQNRNHPYAHGSGSRGYEDSHRHNSDYSSSHNRHHSERRSGGGKQRY